MEIIETSIANNSTVPGWVCSNCGAWVEGPGYHVCYKYTPGTTYQTTPTMKLDEIIELLKEISRKLDRP